MLENITCSFRVEVKAEASEMLKVANLQYRYQTTSKLAPRRQPCFLVPIFLLNSLLLEGMLLLGQVCRRVQQLQCSASLAWFPLPDGRSQLFCREPPYREDHMARNRRWPLASAFEEAGNLVLQPRRS